MGRAARRCALSVVLLTLPLALSASSARANEITGGCTGTVNGKDATLLTKDDPLVVHEGEQLAVSGNIPAEFAAANPPSSTTVKVSVIDGIFDISTDAQESTGAAYTAESVNVDDYFNVGVGLYRVDVVNTGLTWRCEYTGYIKLGGDPLSKPAGLVALAAVVIGAIGVMFSKGRKPREPGWIDTELNTAEQIEREEAWQKAGHEYPDAIDFRERGTHALFPATPPRANERVMWTGKVRRHGHPIAAFFWGLLLGLGIGVLGWQDARWTVNLGSIVFVPLLIAAAAALFAWFGWGYRIRDVAVLPEGTPPVSEPVEPPPSHDPLALDPLASGEVPRSET